MISEDDVLWGSYKDYEGPYVKGSKKYHIPKHPSKLDKYLAIVTATEGGTYDAVNMYDSMICSLGLIQMGEKNQCSVSNLLGHIIDTCGIDSITVPLDRALKYSHASINKNSSGAWRLFLGTAVSEESCTQKAQQRLFLGCDGKKGSWTQENKQKAKLWAACLSNIWDIPETRSAQEVYVQSKLMSYVTKRARELLFMKENVGDLVEATRATYVSFAANIPAVASSQLEHALKNTSLKEFSDEWCLNIIKTLVFGPGIDIYKGRYDKIRPVLESLYNVALPKNSKELFDYDPNKNGTTFKDIILIYDPSYLS